MSSYPSKISERLAYFIFEHDHGISDQPSGKIPQVKSNPCMSPFEKVWGNLSLLFIMFIQDSVSCAIKHLFWGTPIKYEILKCLLQSLLAPLKV